MDADGSQLVEIEPGVPGLERVEGPGDARDLLPASRFAGPT